MENYKLEPRLIVRVPSEIEPGTKPSIPKDRHFDISTRLCCAMSKRPLLTTQYVPSMGFRTAYGVTKNGGLKSSATFRS